MSLDWNAVCDDVARLAREAEWCRHGQEDTLAFLARQLSTQPGVLIADEVGLGKTRVALAVLRAVLARGGSAAVVAPPGLLFQWRKEWATSGGGVDPIVLQGFGDLFDVTGERPYPLAKAGRWLLVSHRFGAPRIAKNSHTSRFRLPVLARTILADGGAMRHDWGTKAWAANELGRTEGHGEEAAARYLAGLSSLRDDFEAFEVRHVTDRAENDRWAEEALAYLGDGAGYRCLRRCYRHLIGSVDLLVIDEAHKARVGTTDAGEESEAAKTESILSGLLKYLMPVRNGRRLALTATPVELDPEQWASVLGRIGVAAPPMPAIEAFIAAHREVDLHPDRPAAITRLVQSCRAYQAALAPIMTRRRRNAQDAMRSLVGEASGTHPHRDASHPIAIRFADVPETWRPAVVAMEGISAAAAGCPWVGHRVKRMASRYAGGLIGRGVSDEEVEFGEVPPDPLDEARRDRIRYWQAQIVATAGTADTEDRLARLAGHPRVLHVADRIERAIWGGDGDGGKILVFGVNTEPLRALRDTLNRRAALRFLDRGLPLPGGRALTTDIDALYSEFLRLRDPAGRRVPGLKHLVVEARGASSLARQLREAGDRYNRLVKSLQRVVDDRMVDQLLALTAPNRTRQESHRVAAFLRARVVSELLGAERPAGSSDDAGILRQRSAKELRAVATRLWQEIVAAHIDTEAENGDPSVAATSNSRLTSQDISELLDDEEQQGARGDFARMLDGKTKMDTRRRLQARFNQADSFPRVLIAQSTVGREGLNLHDCCSHVILFQAEWNPATVEQQIGRVDRIDSKWERDANLWAKGGRVGAMPRIHVERVVFEGTYDEHQHQVLDQRRRSLHAQLFGDLLSEDSRAQVPEELVAELARSAPDFSPRRLRPARPQPTS